LPLYPFEASDFWFNTKNGDNHSLHPQVVPSAKPITVSATVSIICNALATTLGYKPQEIDELSSFWELGLSSITAISFLNIINSSALCNLDIGAVYHYSTIKELALVLIEYHLSDHLAMKILFIGLSSMT
jgi:hypothetical protein